MNDNIDILFLELESKNNMIRKNALDKVLEITEEKVDWIYNKWDDLVKKMDSENSYQRSIGMFVLSNLAKSDTEKRFLQIIDKYLGLMQDEKFITSRQTIQSSWKVAIALEELERKIVDHLKEMFIMNRHLTSHSNLIRKDIVQSFMEIYKVYKNKNDLIEMEMLIESRCDAKVRKSLEKIIKYAEI